MKIQASSIYRIFNCPGSLALESDTPDDMKYKPFADAASLGSLIHNVGEYLIKLDLGTHTYKVTPHKLLTDAGLTKGSFDYDKGLNAATYYRKYFKKVLKQHAKLKSLSVTFIEDKFRLKLEGFDLVCKVDALIITRSGEKICVDIFDLKTGNFNYTKSATDQLRFSAILIVMNLYPDAFTNRFIINTHIVQPNYWEAAYKAVPDAFPLCDYKTIEKYMLDLITDLKENSDTLADGDHCAFCPGLLVCPKIRTLNGMADIVVRENRDRLPDITNEKLEYIWQQKALIEKFLKAVEEQIKLRLETGTRFDNIELVPTSGHRKWIDPKAIIKKFKSLGDDLYQPRKLKSPAQLEKVAGKKNLEGLYEKPQILKLGVRENEDIFGKIE